MQEVALGLPRASSSVIREGGLSVWSSHSNGAMMRAVPHQVSGPFQPVASSPPSTKDAQPAVYPSAAALEVQSRRRVDRGTMASHEQPFLLDELLHVLVPTAAASLAPGCQHLVLCLQTPMALRSPFQTVLLCPLNLSLLPWARSAAGCRSHPRFQSWHLRPHLCRLSQLCRAGSAAAQRKSRDTPVPCWCLGVSSHVLLRAAG